VCSGQANALDEHSSVDDCRLVADRPLHVSTGAGRKVMDELGNFERQPSEVDDVEVGLRAEAQHPRLAMPNSVALSEVRRRMASSIVYFRRSRTQCSKNRWAAKRP